MHLVNNTHIYTSDKHHLSLSTYSAEVFGGASFPTEPALQQHVLELVSQASHHLCGVDVVIGGWGVVVKVQQTQETWLVTVFEDG